MKRLLLSLAILLSLLSAEAQIIPLGFTKIVPAASGGGGSGTLLLDEAGLSTPSVAVSVARKLRSAYAGSCIRVRRSSDNTEQDIGFVSNELDTATLATFCSGTDGYITTLYGQSGAGINFTQTTAASQPQIVSSGTVITLGGKPAMRWSGASDIRLTATVSVATATNGSTFIVYSPIAHTANDRIISANSSRLEFVQQSGAGNYYLRLGGTVSGTFTGPSASTRSISELYFNGSSSEYQNNNATRVTALVTATTTSLTLLSIGGNTTGTTAPNMDFQEGVWWINDLLSGSEQTTVRTNMNAFYAVY